MAGSGVVKTDLVLERVAVALETVDRRLEKLEDESANQAGTAESFVKNLEAITERLGNIANSLENHTALRLEDSARYDRIEAMVSNYVEATKELRQTTVKLHSEVREKLKAVPGG